MPMIKSSTLIYIVSNYEDNELVTSDSLNSLLNDYQDVQKYFQNINIKAPDLIVNNILNYSKKCL